jgi:hypothetical protein
MKPKERRWGRRGRRRMRRWRRRRGKVKDGGERQPPLAGERE